MKDKVKNYVIAAEAGAIAVLLPIASYKLWPETTKEIGLGIVLLACIIGLPAAAIMSERDEPRNPDTY
jgi:hypothetical protein